DPVTEPHRQGLPGVVLLAEEPDLARLLLADHPGQEARAVAAVEAADARAGLAEAGVVRGHGQVADDVEHVAAADGVAGDHGDHGLGGAPDLHLQVEHVETSDAAVVAVAVVAADPLVAARAAGRVAGPGQGGDPGRRAVAG